VAGPIGGTAGIQSSQDIPVSWIQSDPFSNVSIYATLSPSNRAATMEAFLTDRIGPGTTAASDQIASTYFDTPATDGTPQEFLIFSGLNLPAGTYYLTIYPPFNNIIGWPYTSSPNITTAPDASYNGGYTGANNASYPPASDNFASLNFLFRVTGTQAVPEPRSAVSFLVGGVIIGCVIARRRLA
jgi:hypothetical protein